MCGKLCRCCKTCKHCEEYETVDYEYLCSEPTFRCKAKNRDIWFVGMPRPFCKSFEHKSKSESLNAFSAEVSKLTDAYKNMGSNAESISKILNSAIMSASEVQNLAHSETNYKIVSQLEMLEDEAKPCPICGSKPRIQVYTDYSYDLDQRVTYRIGCSRKCGPIWSGFTLDLLIMGWNGYAEGMITRPAIKPKSTNCPNCGAPVDIHAEKCAYCDTPYI